MLALELPSNLGGVQLHDRKLSSIDKLKVKCLFSLLLRHNQRDARCEMHVIDARDVHDSGLAPKCNPSSKNRSVHNLWQPASKDRSLYSL